MDFSTARRIAQVLRGAVASPIVIEIPPDRREDFLRMLDEAKTMPIRLMTGEELDQLPPPVGFEALGLPEGDTPAPALRLAAAVADFAADALQAIMRMGRVMAETLDAPPPAAGDAEKMAEAVRALVYVCDTVGRALLGVSAMAAAARIQLEPASAEGSAAAESPLTTDGPGETAAGRPPLGAFGATPPA